MANGYQREGRPFLSGDFIKFYRGLLDWEWYSDANTSRVFIHLLLNANWKSNRWRGIEIEKGSLLIPTDLLGNSLGLSKQQARNALNKLESTGEITRKTTRYGLLITLCNWGIYQSGEGDSQHPNQHPNQQGTNRESTPKPTGSQQGTNREPTPLEEGKKDKKDKNRRIEEAPTSLKAVAGAWTPSAEQTKLNSIFNRRETTKWSAKEIKALKAIEIDQDDLELVARYYQREPKPGDLDLRRRDLATLLNNWPSEIDRARAALGGSLGGLTRPVSSQKLPSWSSHPKWRKAAGIALDSEVDYEGTINDFPRRKVTEMLSLLKDMDSGAMIEG